MTSTSTGLRPEHEHDLSTRLDAAGAVTSETESNVVVRPIFGNFAELHRHSSEHRDDTNEWKLEFLAANGCDATGCDQDILDCRTLQRRTAGNVEKPGSIPQASLAIPFGNVQRNGLRGPQPLIASVTMKTTQ
ncbi:hypothetical protein RB10687 [Rhodopirellula baltica SH 1]|uniref:Uncharacterized protein n=1 Tax=Rhodopirellula baltica (strain DSM 10527 / NCIMB 13988 / SH1) TaxID=243090 RepID=Q7UKE6_RHOBA|nr:hypothetical protein RB10687 [Rhodopirellula baltica SH 1]